MPPALIANVAPRVIAILGANPGVWSASVSGNVGAFPDLSEITAAMLEADGELITRGYFNSINNTLAEPFMTPSSPLARGAKVPFHYGNTNSVELSKSVIKLTAADVNIATDVITASGNTLTQHTRVSFYSNLGGTLPTGVTAGTTYYVHILTSSTFNLQTSPGGTSVDLTGAGSGSFYLIEWEDGIEAKSADDVAQAIAVAGDYVQAGALSYLFKIENGAIQHASTYARIEYPVYTRTSALQADKADESIIIALTVALLTKNASAAMFEEWNAKADKGIAAIIRDGSYQPGVQDSNP